MYGSLIYCEQLHEDETAQQSELNTMSLLHVFPVASNINQLRQYKYGRTTDSKCTRRNTVHKFEDVIRNQGQKTWARPFSRQPRRSAAPRRDTY